MSRTSTDTNGNGNANGKAKRRYSADDRRCLHLAKTLVDREGKERFKALLAMFEDGATVAEIGIAFGVSKQRASQWRRVLGHQRCSFTSRGCLLSAMAAGTLSVVQ